MQALRLLVHKRIVLWHELPPDFRGNDVVVDLRRSHDEDCAVSKNPAKSDGKNEKKVFGLTYKTMDEFAGGLGEGWTTGTTLRRGVSGRVAEKLLM